MSPDPTLAPLSRMVLDLAAMRQSTDQMATTLAEKRQQFEEEHRPLIDSLRESRELLGKAEARVREFAVDVFRRTGDMKPGPGLGIRTKKRLDYDLAAATAWAEEHGMALMLDVKAFEAIAKASKLDFVTITDQPECTIARDLGSVAALIAPTEERTA